ncbi:Tail-anchored proteins 1 [Diplocarpon rosae]|nr:Tail-anchored proteins 1 [Diplocarpon rosae]
MPSLLLLVFILQLAIHLVNTFGAATINSLLWNLFIRFPTQTSKSAAEQKELKAQYFKIKQQMNATSSQDEFAKWAKLRRQHDRVVEQLEKSKSSTDSTKAQHDRAVTALRWLGTNGLRMFLQFWFSRQAMFWVPKGWMPYAAEWALSFPRAPLGSVSIQAWALACGAVILLVSDACVATAALARGYGAGVQEIGREQKEAIKVLGDEAAAAGKKEL